MSRWGKNIVVPLDSLCKEKENTNRPTVARSVGTVGKWGKMGFTSTRTYALAALPATLPTATSPSDGSSNMDYDMSPSVPAPPKPKKFFKSINTTPPEIMAQIIQQLPRVAPTSPIRDNYAHSQSTNMSQLSPHAQPDAMKMKIPKKTNTKKSSATVNKTPKTPVRTPSIKSGDEQLSDTSESNSVRVEIKSAKKKKELKPEAPPSRVLGRARKTVNYCEEEDDERILISSLKDVIMPKSNEGASRSRRESLEIISPISPSVATSTATTAKAPEHKPIVLRISKVK